MNRLYSVIFRGVHMHKIPKVEITWQLSIFQYDFDFVGGQLIDLLDTRIFKRMTKVSNFYVTIFTSPPQQRQGKIRRLPMLYL